MPRQGILLIDKPAGWTSFDVVNYVRRIVATAEGQKPKSIKVGHTGTLDPFATGLLVLLIGKEYTRRAGEFSKLDKTYELTMRLGYTSTTGDPEGEIIPVTQAAESLETARPAADLQTTSGADNPAVVSKAPPDLVALQAAAKQFTGSIIQTPPIYSAIKVDGQRAYKLARAGKEVVMEPRPATVHRLGIAEYGYPEARLIAEVSSGTYIRVLVTDLGAALGTGAYTTQLRRTTVGPFSISQALEVKQPDLLEHIFDDSASSMGSGNVH